MNMMYTKIESKLHTINDDTVLEECRFIYSYLTTIGVDKMQIQSVLLALTQTSCIALDGILILSLLKVLISASSFIFTATIDLIL